ncbi:glycosyl transferase [Roseibium aquae]|uniref:Glycosyl transferase n=1 Tax=Roseibium aquae TaxID=1323746 RepID=A0A916TKS6_9HYPH|nr:glycosyltransferase [Roseibium aquae]GGB51990.1 glycosyl transferase [Roseibium aquae]
MISVIIPTKNSEAVLAQALASLVTAAAEGVVREVIVVDGGSTDHSEQVADAAGCTWIALKAPRSIRLAEGAKNARRGEWLLFLHPGTLLEQGWHHEVQAFIDRASRSARGANTVAAFRLRHDDYGLFARISEMAAIVRSNLLGMPYGNQGLLISRSFYDSLGGYRPLPDLEDMDMAKRIGRGRMVFLNSAAVMSGQAGQEDGSSGLRQSFARFCVGTLRVPASLAVRLNA